MNNQTSYIIFSPSVERVPDSERYGRRVPCFLLDLQAVLTARTLFKLSLPHGPPLGQKDDSVSISSAQI